MKTPLIALLLLISGTAIAQPTKITYKGDQVIKLAWPSCGDQAKRFLGETYTVTFNEGRVWVNNVQWHLDSDSYVLSYRAQDDAYMSMLMESDFLGGRGAFVTIKGINAKREPCQDSIYFRRIR